METKSRWRLTLALSALSAAATIETETQELIKNAERPLRPAAPQRQLDSATLLGSRGEVEIVHQDETYRLRRTRQGKLILTVGIFGAAMGAFQWSTNPWFVAAKTAAAERLVTHEMLWPLEDSRAWWLLTRYPEANDVFTWLDGIGILAYIGSVTLVLGGFIFLNLVAAARLARADWRRIALGLTMLSLTQLRAEGFSFVWLTWARDGLLTGAVLWSLCLGIRLLRTGAGIGATLTAMLPYAMATGAVTAAWLLQFHRG